MRLTRASILFLLACLLALAACDSDSPTTVSEGLPSASPGLTQGPTVIIGASSTNVLPTAIPTATAIPRIKKGDSVTALAALEQLKGDAVAWQNDAQFVMLANVKPGQESRILGVALSDPDLTDPTPDGTGENWVLMVASDSAKSVVVLDLDGARTDLVAGGKVPASLLAQLTGPDITGVQMSAIKLPELKSSAEMKRIWADPVETSSMSMALISPSRLGLDKVFGGADWSKEPDLVYEVFSSSPSIFGFYNALTGEQLLRIAHE